MMQEVFTASAEEIEGVLETSHEDVVFTKVSQIHVTFLNLLGKIRTQPNLVLRLLMPALRGFNDILAEYPYSKMKLVGSFLNWPEVQECLSAFHSNLPGWIETYDYCYALLTMLRITASHDVFVQRRAEFIKLLYRSVGNSGLISLLIKMCEDFEEWTQLTKIIFEQADFRSLAEYLQQYGPDYR